MTQDELYFLPMSHGTVRQWSIHSNENAGVSEYILSAHDTVTG
jgi:hypothetical protein